MRTWLAGRLFGNPDLPRRGTWLVVFAVCFTAANALGGRVIG